MGGKFDQINNSCPFVYQARTQRFYKYMVNRV